MDIVKRRLEVAVTKTVNGKINNCDMKHFLSLNGETNGNE